VLGSGLARGHREEDMETEVIAERGDYRLVRFRGEDGDPHYALECQGKRVSTDADGDEFHEQVGMVSGSWELWLAVREPGE
jgi:hypothetical protein